MMHPRVGFLVLHGERKGQGLVGYNLSLPAVSPSSSSSPSPSSSSPPWIYHEKEKKGSIQGTMLWYETNYFVHCKHEKNVTMVS